MELAIKLGLITKIYDSSKDDLENALYIIAQGIDNEDQDNLKTLNEIDDTVSNLSNFKIYMEDGGVRTIIIYTKKIILCKRLYYKL